MSPELGAGVLRYPAGAPRACGGGGAGGAYGGAAGSESIFVMKIWRPSIIASRTPPTAADFQAARKPPRAASTPPVAAPEMI